MSRIQDSYSSTANENTSIGGLSIAEGTTQYRYLNDAIRQLMADVKQESVEVRGLIADLPTAVSNASEASSKADTAYELAGGLADAIAQSGSAASTAAALAAQASSAANTATTTLAGVSAEVESLKTRMAAVEDAGLGAYYVRTDGQTLLNVNGVLSVTDVIDGTSTAKARGQIGSAALAEASALGRLTADGLYMIESDMTDLPAGITSGTCRVSSCYAEGEILQTVFSSGSSHAIAMRKSADAGANWSAWQYAWLSPAGAGSHAWTVASGASKNWFRIAATEPQRAHHSSAVFIFKARNPVAGTNDDNIQTWHVLAQVCGRSCAVKVFGCGTLPFSQIRIAYENTAVDVDDYKTAYIDVYLNAVYSGSETALEVEEIHSSGVAFVSDGTLAAASLPTGYETKTATP